MILNVITELIDELELMASTINTEHDEYEGSLEEFAFKEHQVNIIKLKSVFNGYTTQRTALRKIRSVAKPAIADIANIALNAS